jgi:hypothetical protein
VISKVSKENSENGGFIGLTIGNQSFNLSSIILTLLS